MKKEFSLYEFAGILVPSVTVLFFLNYLLVKEYNTALFDLTKIGESLVFIIIAYGLGHVMHSFGNIYEKVVWFLFKGMPTNWITKKPRFWQKLFENDDLVNIKRKLFDTFDEVEGKDYGRNTYSLLSQKQLTGRVDIFNANYSLFRALTVGFLILFVAALILKQYEFSIISGVIYFLSHLRMVRFAKLYAREIFRQFLVME